MVRGVGTESLFSEGKARNPFILELHLRAKEGEESDSGEVIGVEELVIGRAIAASAAAKVKTQTLFEAGTTRSFSF